ncbi:hypothetical protein D5S18_17920 [Nocardia panacis]|uniref:Nuclear transport factor 2 family protein n=1 Tax=Nocardia panacis TaxID=2340916 RepID=A0A3A4KKJ8_9NOCA|nr:hypothetical protein [Nocardia panacis]RJO75231.1 hypothetical protein D5S18_17920 [Nocardia panacis]
MSNRPNEHALARFAQRYAAQWNEPDPALRRKEIEDIWAPDGAQVLIDPPQEIQDAATNLAFPAPTLAVLGHDALAARVTRAYEMFVEPGEFRFETRGATALPGGRAQLTWVMVTVSDGAIVGGGFDIVTFDGDGRIKLNHQFIGLD